MTDEIKAVHLLQTHNIDIENLKGCDAYESDYYLKLHDNAGFDTISELFTDDLVGGIIQLVEGK